MVNGPAAGGPEAFGEPLDLDFLEKEAYRAFGGKEGWNRDILDPRGPPPTPSRQPAAERSGKARVWAHAGKASRGLALRAEVVTKGHGLTDLPLTTLRTESERGLDRSVDASVAGRVKKGVEDLREKTARLQLERDQAQAAACAAQENLYYLSERAAELDEEQVQLGNAVAHKTARIIDLEVAVNDNHDNEKRAVQTVLNDVLLANLIDGVNSAVTVFKASLIETFRGSFAEYTVNKDTAYTNEPGEDQHRRKRRSVSPEPA